jgi:hypothetical protein
MKSAACGATTEKPKTQTYNSQFAICNQLDTNPRILASTLCRREDNENAQIFLNGMKSVFDAFSHEDNRTGSHRAILIGDADLGAATDDVIDLVLIMRLLWIGASNWQFIEACTHGRDTQKFQIRSVPNPSLIL